MSTASRNNRNRDQDSVVDSEKVILRSISPITGTDDVTLIRTVDTSKLVEDWKKSLDIDITNELRGYKQLFLYRCNETGLEYYEPMELAGSGELYKRLQNHDWYYMYNRWEHQLAINHIRGRKNILEIGSGSGNFVELAKKHGLNVTGIELSQHGVRTAQEKGLDVRRVDLETMAELHQGEFDVVCSFQVLEHVSVPKNFIQHSVRLLKPGGLLVYCVPNSESFLKYQYNLLNMPPHHLTLWSEKTLHSIERYFPIRLTKTYREPLAEYHIAGYLGSCKQRLSKYPILRKILFNRYLIALYSLLFKAGLRKIIVGQSIYVCYRKLDG